MKKLVAAMFCSMIIKFQPNIRGRNGKMGLCGKQRTRCTRENWTRRSSHAPRGKTNPPLISTSSSRPTSCPFEFDYGTHATEILNNGHTIQANIAPGSKLRFEKQDI